MKPMESEAMTVEVPSRYLWAFIKMADACRHIDTTAEHIAAMLTSPHVDVAIALGASGRQFRHLAVLLLDRG